MRGRGLSNIGNSVDQSIGGLEDYFKKSKERLTTVTRNSTEKKDQKKNNNKEIEMGRKITVWVFLAIKWQISHQKTLTRLRKENLKSKSESLFIATQITVIKTNYIKAKIDNTLQNSKFRLYDDRDETIIHISECSKLAKKQYKARHNWVRKVIHWELCKKLLI